MNSQQPCKRQPFAVFSLLLFLLSMSTQTTLVEATRLLNAYNSPIEALTSPNNFYFLEFPLDGIDDDGRSTDSYATLSPKCGDGSPYSFAFRRGSDEHLSKLIVEFEGGSACWDGGDGSCCGAGPRQTPWYNYLQNQQQAVVSGGLFPPLNTCTGIPSGFTKEAANVLFGQSTEDLPISVRGGGNGTKQEWWELFGSDGSNVNDWSYILLPHCTMDWHMGFQPSPQATGCGNERAYHRGGSNAEAVLEWVNNQFPSGLDALVTISGGSIGGCDSQNPAYTSSIAPMIFGAGVAADRYTQAAPSSILVLTEGSNLWNPKLPNHAAMMTRWNAKHLVPDGGLLDTAESLVMNSLDAIEYGWLANSYSEANAETEWLTRVKAEKRDSFHVYVPLSGDDKVQSSSCPRFAFPRNSPDTELAISSFFRNIANQMSWSSGTQTDNTQTKWGSSRLTFFSITVLLLAIFVSSWLVYFGLKFRNKGQGQPAPPSPFDLWLIALTEYPRIFLFVSLLIPVILSSVGYSKSDVTVNLDFDNYLNISSPTEDVARSYSKAQSYQFESLDREEANCALLNGELGLPNGVYRGRSRVLEQELDTSALSSIHFEPELYSPTPEERKLYNLYASNGQFISILYENRDGGSVFTPDVLDEIRRFEQSLLEFPGFSDYCMGFSGRCLPFDSIIPKFYPNGILVPDINGVLQTFSSDPTALWKMDQFFGPNNLASNITRTFVWLKDVGGDQSAVNPFLEKIHRELFWKVDQERPSRYPNIVVTWSNKHMEIEEAKDALHHDAIWSAGSLCFIGLMIYLKVRNSFVFLCGMLGLMLSFLTAYYWVSIHFDMQQITLLHVSSLFVMLGIGADDIFLMIDSFEHTKMEYVEVTEGATDIEDFQDDDQDGTSAEKLYDSSPNIIRRRMKVAYSRAGSMMLVSSMTTAVCFFSNAFGVLDIIKEFGIYMGMVVLVNYVHVMTILPSGIMVYELYIVSWKKNKGSKWLFGLIGRKDEAQLLEGGEDADNKKLKHGGSKDNERTEMFDAGSEFTSFGDEQEVDSRKATRRSRSLTDLRESNNDDDGEAISVPTAGKEQNSHLDDISRMNVIDRWLVTKYAPFLNSRHILILAASVMLAFVLGACGFATFAISDGSIVLFSEKYNLGRLQALKDAYFSDDISKTVESSNIGSFPTNAGGNGSGGNDNGGSGNGSGSGSGNNGGSSVQQPIPTPTPTPRPTPKPTSVPTNVPASLPPPSPVAEPTATISTPPQVPASPSSGVGTAAPVATPVVAPVASPRPISSPTAPTNSSGGGAARPTTNNNSPQCSESCQNGGICNFQGRCTCADGWDGESCTIQVCPKGNGPPCSGRGVCVPHPSGAAGSSMCSCPLEFSGSIDCSTRVELSRREAIVVRLIWGVEPEEDPSNLWMIRKAPSDSESERTGRKLMSNVPYHGRKESHFDLSEPHVQAWLLEVVQMARNEIGLNVQPDRPTWIETLKMFVENQGVEFPIRKDMFVGYIDILKKLNPDFAAAIRGEIGTRSPGLAGDFLFTSITIFADVTQSGSALSTTALDQWNHFVKKVNHATPSNVPRVVAQSRSFLDAYRAEQTVDSTLATWFVSNGLCFLIILAFSQNLLLCFMVMVTITLIFMCLAGLLFAVFLLPFGPVEALGVSIFIGLSANYSLHVVHAYHSSSSTVRQSKVDDAIFTVGSPIAASALSTIGGSIFLFACRTYVFVELGILICSITTMALVYSMGFLLAWLKMVGPIPCDLDGEGEQSNHQMHRWDLQALFRGPYERVFAPKHNGEMSPTDDRLSG